MPNSLYSIYLCLPRVRFSRTLKNRTSSLSFIEITTGVYDADAEVFELNQCV